MAGFLCLLLPQPKPAFAMVLCIQSRVEQLREMVQGGSHGGQVVLSSAV